jgi:glutathione synthase/RimK-type ligase-like ATP-grasp enzyme
MIGIHDSAGTFSDRWIQYCTEHGIPFSRINCLASDVISQSNDLDAVLWHWRHVEPSEVLMAPQLITALEKKGMLVYPNSATCAHYDDKVAQKYLLEAIGAPLISTWVFLDERAATKWIEETTFPKVFKLRRGAGSTNVQLVRSASEAKKLCRRAFGRGFRASSGYFADVSKRVRDTRASKKYWEKLRRAPRQFMKSRALRRLLPRQRGYLYFQEYLPDNRWDTRITIVGDRAFSFRRMNRPNDFRASGSGVIVYEPSQVDLRAVQIGFEVSRTLGAQSLAFDFLNDPGNNPMIGEISYCFMAEAVHNCPGYWDSKLKWHEGHIWPQDAILEDLLAARDRSKGRPPVA